TWYCPDMKTFYYSNPKIFRGIFDALDKVGSEAITAAAGDLATLPASITVPSTAFAGAKYARVTTNVLFTFE
ncbi:hypothetical protein BJ878DRAFT_390414, partial [Calycina marina]